jgi:hypothetical protein
MQYLSYPVAVVVVLFSLFSFNTIITNDYVEKWILTKRPIFVQGTERVTNIGLYVREITTADATVAVVSAGAIPYFSERYSIDLLGKIDKVIARMEPTGTKDLVDFIDFQPGHVKWDYDYSIGELKPDVIPQYVDETFVEAQPYLDADYVYVEIDGLPFYLRKDSPNILWDKLP